MTNGDYLLEIDVHECSNEITLTEDYLIKYTANISKSMACHGPLFNNRFFIAHLDLIGVCGFQ